VRGRAAHGLESAVQELAVPALQLLVLVLAVGVRISARGERTPAVACPPARPGAARIASEPLPQHGRPWGGVSPAAPPPAPADVAPARAARRGATAVLGQEAGKALEQRQDATGCSRYP
jgi:hypothetical protein